MNMIASNIMIDNYQLIQKNLPEPVRAVTQNEWHRLSFWLAFQRVFNQTMANK